MRTKQLAVALAGISGAVGGLATAPAGAAPQSPDPLDSQLTPGVAAFEGEVVPMTEVWDDATVCSVYTGGKTYCFATQAEADAHAAAYDEDVPEVGVAAICLEGSPGSNDRWLRLRNDSSGRVLQFHEVSVTQNLSTWDFDNRADTWGNNMACNVTLYEGAGGGGSTYWVDRVGVGGNTSGACWESPACPIGNGLKDKVSSFRIHTRG